MTDDAGILVEIDGGLAVVTVHNPRTRNALTPELADELVRRLDAIDADPDIGALVITGADGTFCSGADLSSLGRAMADPAGDDAYQALERIYAAFTRVGHMAVPTIAALRGAAVGAGLNLAMAVDLRVVAHSARLISGFGRLGLHPGGGHLLLLARASNAETAVAMGLLQQAVDGQRAVELGLAWTSVEDEQVEATARTIAASAAADPALSRRMIRSLRMTAAPAVAWDLALQAERAPQLWSLRRSAARQTKVP